MRGAWIEIDRKNDNGTVTRSLPVRGAWIEIMYLIIISTTPFVAPCEGSVD